MATIGNFTKDKTGYTGTIETLTCAPASVRITPVSKPNDQAPDHRVYRGASEIGAAWSKTARNGRSYLIVILDDPAFSAPIQSRLVKAGRGYTLIWSRAD